jgi:hypothetical protein
MGKLRNCASLQAREARVELIHDVIVASLRKGGFKSVPEALEVQEVGGMPSLVLLPTTVVRGSLL